MHFFITGHTGFKGSWLILLLKHLGHDVSGYSLDAARGGLFERAGLQDQLETHFVGDIRDRPRLKSAINEVGPDFAIHLAAQPLVLRSYQDPLETLTTNVDGTRNFLEAISNCRNAPVSLVVTTDKVYRDDGKSPYQESDPLGGLDPYSASKAMADILTQSWAFTHPGLKLHVARAGNVIGAFDVSEDRLLPDIIRSLQSKQPLVVRNLNSVRPWQHVLDCLSGYLSFLFQVAEGQELPVVLNFGPDASSVRKVIHVLEEARKSFDELRFRIEPATATFKETDLLTLDSSKSNELLGWHDFIPFERAVAMALEELHREDALSLVNSQIKEFMELSAGTWSR